MDDYNYINIYRDYILNTFTDKGLVYSIGSEKSKEIENLIIKEVLYFSKLNIENDTPIKDISFFNDLTWNDLIKYLDCHYRSILCFDYSEEVFLYYTNVIRKIILFINELNNVINLETVEV